LTEQYMKDRNKLVAVTEPLHCEDLIVSTHTPYDDEIGVLGTNARYDSNLQNYADYYDEWDEVEEDRCPSCHGTGMDKWEEFECEDCAGEGYIPRSGLLTRR
jgi:hypothetical protein